MKTPWELLKESKTKIKTTWRIAFVSALVLGLLIHLPVMLSDIPNHDGLGSMYFDQNMITSGRWFLTVACGFSSYFTIPWVIGLIGLIWLALAAVALTELLELADPLVIMAVSGLLISFPALASTFAYVFTMDGYMLALFLAVLAVLFTAKYPRGYLAGAVCLAFSMGIYQAYLPFTILLCVYKILLFFMEEKGWKEKAKYVCRYLGMGIAGGVLYYVILQILPTHPIIIHSVEQAIEYGKPGNIVVDLSSTAPDIVLDLYKKTKNAGMYLLDSPVSGGNPMAIAGTLAIMTGGDKEAFEQVKPLLECMGHPVYTGGAGSGSVTKLVNNIVAGAYMVVIAEAYTFAAKAGIDLQTTFEATRGGFAGGPVYDNKVPKLIHRDYEPGARVAVHRKDILNAKHFAHHMGVDTPMTDVVLMVMDWMNDNGHINEDQIAMVKYYEDKMDVKVGNEDAQ